MREEKSSLNKLIHAAENISRTHEFINFHCTFFVNLFMFDMHTCNFVNGAEKRCIIQNNRNELQINASLYYAFTGFCWHSSIQTKIIM